MSDQARILGELANHLEAVAELLRQLTDGQPSQSADAPLSSGLAAGDQVIERARRVHPALGERQEQVLRLVADSHPKGITTGEIWRPINYDQTNVYLTLNTLARHGLVRKDSSAKPHRYYLGRQFDG